MGISPAAHRSFFMVLVVQIAHKEVLNGSAKHSAFLGNGQW